MNNLTKLYLLKIPDHIEQKLFDRLLKCVDAVKRERILNCRNQNTVKEMLLGDLTVRYLAAQSLSLKKEDVVYRYNKDKKPYLSGYDSFKFNISHSGGFVAVAAGPHEVGCDIQEYKEDIRGIERIVFSDAEQKIIKTNEDFFRIWALKESFLKAIGKGFMAQCKEYTVADNKGAVKVLYENREYQFCEYHEMNHYAIAVCADGAIDSRIKRIRFDALAWEF